MAFLPAWLPAACPAARLAIAHRSSLILPFTAGPGRNGLVLSGKYHLSKKRGLRKICRTCSVGRHTSRSPTPTSGQVRPACRR